MESHKEELVAELKRITEENQKLACMMELMSTNYRRLQAHLIKQQEAYAKSCGSKSMAITRQLDLNIAEQEQEEDLTTGGSASAVSQQTSESSLEKSSTYMVDESQLPSKKRKTNYEVGNSSLTEKDSTLSKKQNRGLNKGSSYQVKKIVTIRTKSEATKDGCHWRKYGQKMTRNNPCPRSYFKCGMSPCCPVKKQVQRCPQDPTVFIITYRGEHDHLMGSVDMAAMSNRPRFPASVSSSSFPTISLDLTSSPDPRQNPNPHPGLFHGYPQLAEQYMMAICGFGHRIQ